MAYFRDWCISRQLWWGIRIPAYLVIFDDPKAPPSDMNDSNCYVSAVTEEEALEKASKKFGLPKEKITLKQGIFIFNIYMHNF